jgi:hypothetical protein
MKHLYLSWHPILSKVARNSHLILSTGVLRVAILKYHKQWDQEKTKLLITNPLSQDS